MFISGSLKRKTIDKYCENTLDFDKDGVSFDKGFLSYDGELIYLPFEDLEKRLIAKQEKYMTILKNKIKEKAKEQKMNNYYIDKIIKTINTLSRKYACALLEELYKIVLDDNSYYLRKLYVLVECARALDNKNQIEFELVLDLFRKGQHYGADDIEKLKAESFYLYSEEEFYRLNNKMRDIIKMGMFISPDRVSYLGKRNVSDELSEYYLPIYFLIKDEKLANSFITEIDKGCSNVDDVIKIANNKQISRNLIKRF